MMEFVQQAAKQLGIDESASRALTGGLLGMIQQGVGAGDFAQLMAKLPGAQALVGQGLPAAQAAPAAAGPGGLAGALMGKVGGALGGQAGSAVGLLGMFKDAGLGGDQGKQFLALFVGFVKSKAGPDLIGRLLGQVPALAHLAA